MTNQGQPVRFGREYTDEFHTWTDIGVGRSKQNAHLVKMPSKEWAYCASWGDPIRDLFPDGIRHFTAAQLRQIADKIDELNK